VSGSEPPPVPDPRIPRSLCGGLPAPEHPAPAPPDPLRYCVFTTVALLAWVVGPAFVAAMAGLGLVAYGRIRTGRRRTRCLLRDVRLVLAYLSVVFTIAAASGLRSLFP